MDLIILVVFLGILALAVKGSVAHFKGEGSCCGGGGQEVKSKAKKLDSVACIKVLKIEGMHCEHCYTRVHNALNSLEGVSAKVYGKQGKAVVKCETDPGDDLLRRTVEKLDYTVTSVESKAP
ncbi:MAG: cation transporter [Lachnospiraceae bacterium]|nr:cation transporter [Lachnospiraceae bacterium]